MNSEQATSPGHLRVVPSSENADNFTEKDIGMVHICCTEENHQGIYQRRPWMFQKDSTGARQLLYMQPTSASFSSQHYMMSPKDFQECSLITDSGVNFNVKGGYPTKENKRTIMGVFWERTLTHSHREDMTSSEPRNLAFCVDGLCCVTELKGSKDGEWGKTWLRMNYFTLWAETYLEKWKVVFQLFYKKEDIVIPTSRYFSHNSNFPICRSLLLLYRVICEDRDGRKIQQ